MIALNATGCGDDVGELDLEHVAGFGALDKDRAGQRVHRAGIDVGKIGDRRARLDLAVERVARLQRHLLALADLDDRRDVRVKAVVAAVRLLGERLRPVDFLIACMASPLDRFHPHRCNSLMTIDDYGSGTSALRAVASTPQNDPITGTQTLPLFGRVQCEGSVRVMKLPPFDYACPTTLPEAVQLLASGGGDAKVLAGGQSLMPMLAFRLAHPTLLVDLRKLADLRGIRILDKRRHARRHGALARHRGRRAARGPRIPCSRPRSRMSRTTRSAIAAPSAAASRMPIRLPKCRGSQ